MMVEPRAGDPQKGSTEGRGTGKASKRQSHSRPLGVAAGTRISPHKRAAAPSRDAPRPQRRPRPAPAVSCCQAGSGARAHWPPTLLIRRRRGGGRQCGLSAAPACWLRGGRGARGAGPGGGERRTAAPARRLPGRKRALPGEPREAGRADGGRQGGSSRPRAGRTKGGCCAEPASRLRPPGAPAEAGSGRALCPIRDRSPLRPAAGLAGWRAAGSFVRLRRARAFAPERRDALGSAGPAQLLPGSGGLAETGGAGGLPGPASARALRPPPGTEMPAAAPPSRARWSFPRPAPPTPAFQGEGAGQPGRGRAVPWGLRWGWGRWSPRELPSPGRRRRQSLWRKEPGPLWLSSRWTLPGAG